MGPATGRWRLLMLAPIAGLAAVAGLVVAGSSCVQEETRHIPPDTDSVAAPLSVIGIERIIPLRFILMQPTSADNVVADATIHARIDGLNALYAPAGVQFYPKSIERHLMPLLTLLGGGSDTNNWWDQSGGSLCTGVCNEIRRPFPSVPTNAWPATTLKAKSEWLRLVPLYFAPPEEILVWVNKTGNSSQGAPPFGWRSVQMTVGDLGSDSTTGHEIGHFMGLPHVFAQSAASTEAMEVSLDNAPAFTYMINPITGQPRKMADFWDLVYRPGSNPVYDTPSSIVGVPETDLYAIDRPFVNPGTYCKDVYPVLFDSGIWGPNENCCFNFDLHGSTQCKIQQTSTSYSEIKSTPHAALAGISAIRVGDAPGSGIYNRAVNVMGYNPGPNFLSKSQVDTIRGFLRYDVPNRYATAARPTGYLYSGRSGARPRLGTATNRRPSDKLDFDNDGIRDFGVWQPPGSDSTGVGHFLVRLSSTGVTQDIVWTGGTLTGAVPVPADYRGDGRTDLALVRIDAPTNAFQWEIWDALSSRATVSNYGSTGDIPIAGWDYDGDAKHDLILYRPATGRWYMRPYSGSFIFRDLGGVQFDPVPGDYNGDGLIDLAVWNASTAYLDVAASGANNWVNSVATCFDGTVIAAESGTATARSAGVPIVGNRALTGGTWHDAFSVWDPESGITFTRRDPATLQAGCVTTGCAFGTRDSLPMSTKRDVDGDGLSDLMFLHQDSVGSTWLDRRGSFCGTSSSTLVVGSSRSTVWSTDVNNDGNPDVVIHDADQATFRIYYGPNFTAAPTVYTIGNQAGEVL
jgi:hypothetical protein